MKRVTLLLIIALSIIKIGNMSAQNVYVNENKIANNGYDVVNYFTTNTAQRGSSEYSTEHKGATYYFSSAENLVSFKKNPQKYLPQFDGYCAFAVGKMNKKVPVDPETFRIDDGKLYLFFNDYYDGKPFNTIVPWLANEAEMEKAAAANWEALKGH